jgi:hypothetical protein
MGEQTRRETAARRAAHSRAQLVLRGLPAPARPAGRCGAVRAERQLLHGVTFPARHLVTARATCFYVRHVTGSMRRTDAPPSLLAI